MSRPRRYPQVLAVAICLAWSPLAASACMFCERVNFTLSERINGNEVALIATMTAALQQDKDGDNELTPAVFRVDPDTHQVALLQDNPSEKLRSKVELAVKYCPTRALSIDED